MNVVHACVPTVADVFATEALERRAPKKTDYLQEKRAFQALAARMAETPEAVLPGFVELAMEMTGGTAAGVSLYEEEPAPGVFRWRYLRGVLARFENATTPRHFSPCGVTLDQNRPVLSVHPERVYSWIAEAGIVVPEVLLVPLYLGGGVPLGTLWIVADQPEHFDSGHARVMTELAAFVGIALHMLRAEHRLQQALEEQRTLAREMSHRVKNLFAMTDAMIRISAMDTTTKEELARVLSGRLHAMASAHALVRRTFGDAQSAARTSDLGALVRTILRPHEAAADGAPAKFTIGGPPVQCGDQAMNGLALVVHELATNAAKYGALRSADGRIDIDWRQEDGILALRWAERGGPDTGAPPESEGFGSVLVRNTIVRQFEGTLDYDWRPEGLVVRLCVPMERVAI